MTGLGWSLGALLAAGAIASATQAQPPPPGKPAAARGGHGRDCFYITQLEGDQAQSDRSMILRVGVSDYYRLDFADRCTELTYVQPRLILTPVGGSGLVCGAIDLDVKVGEQGPGDIPQSCIPSELRRMTPAEVAATPRKDLP